MKPFRPIFTLTLLSVQIAASASIADVDFLGFSSDGKFAAMEQYWISDGSGFPGARIVVLSVADNTIMESFQSTWNEEMMYVNGEEMYYENSSNPARVTLLASAQSLLDSLGISAENTGTHCICHPLTDTGCEPEIAQFATNEGAVIYGGLEYDLRILNHPSTPDSPPEWLSMFEEPVLLEALIMDSDGNIVTNISEESFHPLYEYVSNYRIRDVFVYNDRLVAIILNTTEPGFEGSDRMFRMITGIIEEMD
jgi:predicted secreted protein